MKIAYLLSFGLLLSCSTIKKEDQSRLDNQLLKDVEVLSSDAYEGRKTDTKGAEMARTYIKGRFEEIGLKPHPSLKGFEQSFTFKNRSGQDINGKNLVAYLPGKTENVIVITAHYDHVGIIKNEVYNGADDNASGVAALLNFARYFSKNKPNNTLVFVAFDAEEMGLQGAKSFVANPPVPLANIRLNINMDMISHNDKGELYVSGTFKYPELKPFIHTTIADIKVIMGHDDPKQGRDDWTNQSDQGAFNAKNIPFLYFGVEDHKDYHQATDEFQNINKLFFMNATRSILEIIKNIDGARSINDIFRENLQMKKQ